MQRGQRCECVQQGCVEEARLQQVLTVLRGVCGGEGTPFRIWEVVYHSKGGSRGAPANTAELRVRSPLDEDRRSLSSSLLYMGSLDIRDSRTTTRNISETSVSSNFSLFLPVLGFQFHHEFVREGWLFVSDAGGGRRVHITVAKLLRLTVTHSPRDTAPLFDGHWIVELIASSTAQTGETGKVVEKMNEDLLRVASALGSVVVLSKIERPRAPIRPPPAPSSPASTVLTIPPTGLESLPASARQGFVHAILPSTSSSKGAPL